MKSPTLLELWLGNAPSPELAAAVREETDGNPRRVDELAARLAEAELDQRVERAVARAAAAQRDLRTVHGRDRDQRRRSGPTAAVCADGKPTPPEPAGSARVPLQGTGLLRGGGRGVLLRS